MNHKAHRLCSASVVSVFAVMISVEATAAVDCDRLHTGGHEPTAQELTDCLTGQPLTRGIRRVPQGTQAATAHQGPSVSMAINFEFGSSSLTYDAKRQLITLGEALNSASLLDNKFVIEGHTDSVGSAHYNQRLSESRARAVKHFLVTGVGVKSTRLEAVGRGEMQLLDKGNPASAVNRRVQIVNLQTSQ